MVQQLTISYGDTAEGAIALEEVLQLMADNGAVFEIETVQLGAELVKLGFEQGFDEEVLRKIRCSRTLLKAPTVNDVTTPLRAALGDEIVIFEPLTNTPQAMRDAAIQMLRHFGQEEIAKRIG